MSGVQDPPHNGGDGDVEGVFFLETEMTSPSPKTSTKPSLHSTVPLDASISPKGSTMTPIPLPSSSSSSSLTPGSTSDQRQQIQRIPTPSQTASSTSSATSPSLADGRDLAPSPSPSLQYQSPDLGATSDQSRGSGSSGGRTGSGSAMVTPRIPLLAPIATPLPPSFLGPNNALSTLTTGSIAPTTTSSGNNSTPPSGTSGGSGGSTTSGPASTGLGISSHWNRGITAPTAPSPLARASIVPPTSDSEERSSTESTDDGDSEGDNRKEREKEGSLGSGSIKKEKREKRVRKDSPWKSEGRISPHRLLQSQQQQSSSQSMEREATITGVAGPGPSTMRQRESPPPPSQSPGSSPKTSRRKERFSLGSPSLISTTSMPPYPYPYAMPSIPLTAATTPGMLLRGKTRQGSGSSVGSSGLAAATSPTRLSPTESEMALGGPSGLAMTSGSPRQRTRSGSFGSMLGSSFEGGRQRSESGSSHVSRLSLLGLTNSGQAGFGGVGGGGGGVGGGGASPEKSTRDGMSELGSDLSRAGSLRDSPGRARQKMRQPSGSGMGLAAESNPFQSPTRSRRFSEFPPTNDNGGRRSSITSMTMMGPPSRLGLSASSMIPVSTVSPLNPLPSPWGAPPSDTPGSRIPGLIDSPVSSGAIRLTRVPESIRQANSQGLGTPDTASSGAGSLSGSLRLGTSPLAESAIHSAMAPIPATPAATRAHTPEDTDGSGQDSMPVFARSVPSSPRAQHRLLGRTRSVMHPPSAFDAVQETIPFSLNSPTTQNPQRTSRNTSSGSYIADRTESVSPPFPAAQGGLRVPSPLIRTRSITSSEDTSPLDARNFGLGVDMPAGGSASRMSLGGAAKPRFLPRHVRQISATSIETTDSTNKELLGDASRHASMIMQSRKAKMQRWRPGSSGRDSSQTEDVSPVKPPMGRASSSSEIIGHRYPGERLAAWKMQSGETREGEAIIDMAPITDSSPSRHPSHRVSYGQEIDIGDDQSSRLGFSSIGMKREASQSESVNGIEWVDWMDEYKRYKEAKLRAERAAEATAAGPPSLPATAMLPKQTTTGFNSGERAGESVERSNGSDNSPYQSLPLQPTESRTSLSEPLSRNRSASLRSNASTALAAVTTVRSSPPNSRKPSQSDRARQTSQSLSKSQQSSSGKKKKNLSNKMEGWWNAVKSNFGGPTPPNIRQSSTTFSKLPPFPPMQPVEETGPLASPAVIPSQPSSRRGSRQENNRQEISSALGIAQRPRWLRSSTSHADLGGTPPTSSNAVPESISLHAASSYNQSTGDLGQAAVPFPQVPTPARTQSAVHRPVASGLETRRRQPQLSLKLEQHVLSYPQANHNRQPSSASGILSESSRDGLSHWGSGALSSQHSAGFISPFASMPPGMTPSLTQWDNNSSPVWAMGARQVSDPKMDPQMPQPGDFSTASVMKHIRHRLAVAKDACDAEVRNIIAGITAFVEENMHQPQSAQDSALDADDDMDLDRPIERLMDAFEGESDSEQGIAGIPIGRQRQHTSLSRHGSMSMGNSPGKRRDFMPSSFKALASGPLSPERRRSSGLHRSSARPTEIGQRLSRNLNMAVTRSGASSRSTSRSRSPLPGSSVMAFLNTFETESPVDSGVIAALQELITIATDVLDLSVNALIARPAICQEIIGKVRAISLWNQHLDYPGRNWWLSLLLAMAALTRVMDWWAAEKDFWNFDDDGEAEPLTFVMKPLRDEETPNQTSEEGLRVVTDLGRSLPDPVSATSISPVDGNLPAAESAAPSTITASTGENLTARPEKVEVSNQALAIEDLQGQAEHAKSVNIVLELSLGEELIEWVNPAWQEVIGSDPEEALGTPITAWLAPADVEIVANASRELEKDDSLTAQARFRLVRITTSSDQEDSEREPGPSFIEFEGIGMLMRDRETGAPSHTMWVIKPVASAAVEIDADQPTTDSRQQALGPTLGQLAHVLCRICERDIPLWFFEKHNETCNEVHRLEADIALINEKMGDMARLVTEIRNAIDSPMMSSPAQYLGQRVTFAPRSLDDLGPATISMAVRKIQLEVLDDALEILNSTKDISTPSVRDESEPSQVHYQGLLSPRSEDKLTMAAKWIKPTIEDQALATLLSDLEATIRQKHMTVNRLRNTILYSERVRQEWEEKMDRMMAISEESSGEGSGAEKSGEEGGLSNPASPDALQPQCEDAAGNETSAKAPQRTLSQRKPSKASTEARTNRHVSLGSLPIARRGTPESAGTSISGSDKPTGRHHAEGLLSPRLPATVPSSKTAAPSIKDFDIIKPISRGAFGSVYLAKKRATGDYFAIKALKKSDMIAKNQITNVKAERTILMNQASSPYVAKLFFSFQNKEYLYLVMEYLNGGDCATLIKTLGGLTEDWARNYIAEVVLGLEYLHERGIVHRDLKPDNLLIDAHGHLKLTDFGLSRIGLLNRQIGGPRPAYLKQANLHRLHGSQTSTPPHSVSMFSGSPGSTPDGILPRGLISGQGYFSSRASEISADESSGSESLAPFPTKSSTSRSGNAARPSVARSKSREVPKFVGTPDYLCPESVLGIGTDDDTVDWWALGVVTYEFLYGFPPFNAETPEKVFDNIISRRIKWFEGEQEISPEARDFMERLMCMDPGRRLGANGAAEVKSHPFFAGIDWNTISTVEAHFVPNPSNPEDTDYFDARGAVPQVFTDPETRDEEGVSPLSEQMTRNAPGDSEASRRLADSPVPKDDKSTDDFGAFTFKNLPVLKQANDDVIRKLRSEQAIPQPSAMTMSALRDRRLSQVSSKRRSKVRPALLDNMPPSPAPSTASSGSTPSRSGHVPTTPVTAIPDTARLKGSDPDLTQDTIQRSQSLPIASLPSTLTTSAAREIRKLSGSSSLGTVQNRAVDVMIAEDNPISQKILETLLTRMGCRCVCVNDGAEALAASMGDLRFDVMIFDLVMPNVSGEEAARMIRSTSNPNANTPIIAATAYDYKQTDMGSGAIFSAILPKPITKQILSECFKKLGFVLGSAGGSNLPPGSAAVGSHQPKHGDPPMGDA